MKLRWLLGAPAALLLGGVPLSADTLVMEDGRKIQGELVQVRRGVIWFNEERDLDRTRRIRVRVEDVARIDFRDMNDDDELIETSPHETSLHLDRTVTVRGDARWVDSGLTVRAGDTLRFETDGVVLWGPGRQDGPAGEANSPYNANRPMPNRPAAALIGRIGTTGDVFFIGDDRGLFRARTSGRLYLAVNDDYLADNSGSFRVRVFH